LKQLNTIRFRLTIWNSLVVVLLTLLALFFARQGIIYTLRQETYELLREELTELELAVKELHPDLQQISEEFDRKVQSHVRHNWFAQLIDKRNKVLWKSSNYPDEFSEITASQSQKFVFRQDEQSIVCSHPVKVKSGEQFLIVLGEPTKFIQRDTWIVTRTLLLIGVAMLIVGPIGGYALARQALKPVQQIVDSTKKLGPSNLSQRLHIRGTGDELDQISTEINAFVDLISKYINTQREFVANAAHELRSPLTAIQTSVEVCLSKPRSDEEYCEQLETVTEQCQFLRHLVNQLLELAELDSGFATDQSEFGLSELVHKSLSIFSGVAEEKDIRVEALISPGIKCRGNPTKLIQVVNNLLDNAIKFTPIDGKIRIELTSNPHEIHFRITDSGPGVPEDKLDKIFERFFQIDASRESRETRGNGLGLSICKAIIHANRGHISAQNTDLGFTVEFTLPTCQSKNVAVMRD
jgi:two-component system, OmpR family, heavy metal sensor histidine kinase CusS